MSAKRDLWAPLAVLAFAQFMVVLDITIVNVALPSIQRDLPFSNSGLQWVISAYTLTFGGFLLLGGRLADLLGRRRMFLVGLSLFGLTSLAAGLAQAPGQLVAARAVQGLGGALLSPAALSILLVTYDKGKVRAVALGVWGGLAGLGGTLGVVLGGFLIDALSWRYVFFVNVPIAMVVLVLTPVVVSESRAQMPGRRAFDLAGAVIGTATVLALVYGVIRANDVGWGSRMVIACLVGSAVGLALFVTVESRSAAPLVPLHLFRRRIFALSAAALGLNGATFLSMFFLTVVFLQQVRGQTPLGTGVDMLPMGAAAVVSAVIAQKLVVRFDTRPVQTVGALFSCAGLLVLSRVGAHGMYAAHLLPGLLLLGIGIIALMVPAQIAALAEVGQQESGAASGLLSSCYQIGGAVGLAVITTVSTTRVTAALATGNPVKDALVDGFHRGMLAVTLFAALGIVLAVAARRIPTPRTKQSTDILAGRDDLPEASGDKDQPVVAGK